LFKTIITIEKCFYGWNEKIEYLGSRQGVLMMAIGSVVESLGGSTSSVNADNFPFLRNRINNAPPDDIDGMIMDLLRFAVQFGFVPLLRQIQARDAMLLVTRSAT
jgi:hypothetical protein